MAGGKKGASRTHSRYYANGDQGSLYGSFNSASRQSGLPTRETRFPRSCDGDTSNLAVLFRVPANSKSVGPDRPPLSLRDEARNTERQYLSSSNVRLRHSQVSFVKAEELVTNKYTDPYEEQGKDSIPAKHHPSTPSVFVGAPMSELNLDQEERASNNDSTDNALNARMLHSRRDKAFRTWSPPALCEPRFVVDTTGSGAAINTGLMPPLIRSSSPSDSSSSDEVIVFAGRSRAQRSRIISISKTTRAPGQSKTATISDRLADKDEPNDLLNPPIPESDHTADTIVDHLIAALDSSVTNTISADNLSEPFFVKKPFSSASVTPFDRSGQRASQGGRTKRTGKKPRKGTKQDMTKEPDEAILADYIANMSDTLEQETSLLNGPITEQKVGATENDESQEEEARTNYGRRPGQVSCSYSGWNSSDIGDLDDFSTSDEASGNISAVVWSRERSSGLQYLVVCEGSTVDDAKWLPSASLRSESAIERIRLFEERHQSVNIHLADDSDTTEPRNSNEAQESETDEGAEALQDDEDPLRRRISRMTDEKIARLLAKQEELGMGSDELVLFDDGIVNTDSVSDAPEIRPKSVAENFESVFRTKTKNKRLKNDLYATMAPDDMLYQEVYNDFDVMDHDRSSLRKKLKGRRGLQDFQVSDAELDVALSTAWHKDRLKKQGKKQEREELRAQGLLGRKNKNKADLKAKYIEGMTMDQVKGEIRDFLFSANER